MPLILGDTANGSVTVLQQPNGAVLVFKDATQKPFAQFHMDREKLRWFAQKLITVCDRQDDKAAMDLGGGIAS